MAASVSSFHLWTDARRAWRFFPVSLATMVPGIIVQNPETRRDNLLRSGVFCITCIFDQSFDIRPVRKLSASFYPSRCLKSKFSPDCPSSRRPAIMAAEAYPELSIGIPSGFGTSPGLGRPPHFPPRPAFPR
jgi:hypothetical protein